MLIDIIASKDWPKDDGGCPDFTSTEDATFYAQLIADNLSSFILLIGFRRKFLEDLRIYRSLSDPNIQAFHNLAVKAQLIRECIEEVIRIRNNV